MKGIVVCVGFDDLLKITLPRNLHHLEECLVVTSLADERTKQLVEKLGCQLHQTDAFYRGGARFNKGLAMEEGFDVLGRDDWTLIWDADIIFPKTLGLPNPDKNKLYTIPRRIMEDPREWHERLTEADWRRYPPGNDRVFAGYFQLFHPSCGWISQRPWYDTTFNHAGGGDGYFQSRWPMGDKVRLPYECLHLGPRDSNWFGRVTGRVDGQEIDDRASSEQAMKRYLGYKGWKRNVPVIEDFDEHVKLDGHEPSGFKLLGRKDR